MFKRSGPATSRVASGFRDGPLRVRPPEEISYGTGKCALGAILVASGDKGIVTIMIRPKAAELMRDLQARFPKAILTRDEKGCKAAVAKTIKYVAAPVGSFALPLDIRGTPFQQSVWREVRKITFGETSTYSTIAEAIGAPKAVRMTQGRAARAVATGEADLVIAGGVESMTRAPLVTAKATEAWARGNVTTYDSTLGWRFVNPRMEALYGTHALGETAELVAEMHKVGREEQDAFALESQVRWAAAQAAGRWTVEICAVEIPTRKGTPRIVDTDEHPRPGTTAADLAALRPAFRKIGGTVTAGNSSGINDGAAALLVASEEGLRRLSGPHSEPLVRVLGSAVAGVEPRTMGLGPIPATRKLLQRMGVRASDIDLIELNEAFAAQAIPCIRDMGFDPTRVNVNGGAIAIGHPLGCSGARLAGTLAHELSRRGGGTGLAQRARYGLATMCIGVGQGISLLVERASG